MGENLQPRTVRHLIKWITSQLNENKIISPEQNAETIISHVLKLKRLDLYINQDIELTDTQLREISKFTKRRMKGEPIQYILGETEFYSCRIKVNKSVLIPRPETEYLVEKIINENPNVKSILEIGTGSGCIAIALKKNFINSKITASDISSDALKITKKNAEINNVEIEFIESDLFQNIDGKFDVIVSNPPYISQKDFEQLPDEIKKYEPELALLAPNSGLYYYQKILQNAKEHLTESGKIYFEIGYDQADRIAEIAKVNGFKDIQIFQDLNNFARIMRIY